jgi:hypothetical protein
MNSPPAKFGISTIGVSSGGVVRALWNTTPPIRERATQCWDWLSQQRAIACGPEPPSLQETNVDRPVRVWPQAFRRIARMSGSVTPSRDTPSD